MRILVTSSIAKIHLVGKTPFKHRYNLHISLEYVFTILVFKIFCSALPPQRIYYTEVELSQKSVTGRQKLSQCAKERHSPPRTQISRWRPSVSEYNRHEKHTVAHNCHTIYLALTKLKLLTSNKNCSHQIKIAHIKLK